jgi:hypothetical protein
MLRTILTLCLALGLLPGSVFAADDAHFIQPDDFFISDKELGRDTYMYVKLAKMTTAPTDATRGDGEFLQVENGHTKWTRHFWRTRIASPADLKLGQQIIAFHDHTPGGIYQAPTRKENARGQTWWYAKITDITDTYKGYVTVAGRYKVGLGNIRIPVPYSGAEPIAPPPTAAPVAVPEYVAPPEPKRSPLLAEPEAAAPWNGGDWVEVRFGGCDVPNVRRSKQPVPDADFCNAQMNGKVAVCNAEFGCLYKNVTPRECKNGSQTGRMYVCTPN